MNRWVIGDIQGCYREFVQLMDRIDFQPGDDELWLVGDLVNRGPDNAAVMDLILDLPGVTCVLGNHDLHFLAIAMGQQTSKRGDTIDDLLASRRLQEYIDFFRHMPLIHRDAKNNLVLVHAGLPPQLDLEKCLRLAAEVESALKSNSCTEFLAAMYGNEPDCWHDDLTGMDRLRVITNYFTRLRFCKADGQVELTHKTDVAPPGFDPWFSFPRPGTESIIFGHWAALEGNADTDFVVPMDTGCVWGRELTAMNLDTREKKSVTAMATGS